MLALSWILLSRAQVPSVSIGCWCRIEGLYSQANATSVPWCSPRSVILCKSLLFWCSPLETAPVCAVSGISVAPKTEMFAQCVIKPVKTLVSRIEICWLIEKVQRQLAVACVILVRILVLLRGRILPLPHGPRMSRPIVQDGCEPPRAPLSTAPKTVL